MTEPIINAILPALIKGLDSQIPDFKSSSYVILGYLSTKTTLSHNILNEIVDKILNSDITYDAVLLINLIYNTQHPRELLDPILYNISAPIVTTICEHLKKLVENKIKVQVFVTGFLSSILGELQKDAEVFMMYSDMPVILIDMVDLSQQNPEKIIK